MGRKGLPESGRGLQTNRVNTTPRAVCITHGAQACPCRIDEPDVRKRRNVTKAMAAMRPLEVPSRSGGYTSSTTAGPGSCRGVGSSERGRGAGRRIAAPSSRSFEEAVRSVVLEPKLARRARSTPAICSGEFDPAEFPFDPLGPATSAKAATSCCYGWVGSTSCSGFRGCPATGPSNISARSAVGSGLAESGCARRRTSSRAAASRRISWTSSSLAPSRRSSRRVRCSCPSAPCRPDSYSSAPSQAAA